MVNIKACSTKNRCEDKLFPDITYFLKKRFGRTNKIISLEDKQAHTNAAMYKNHINPPKSKIMDKINQDTNIFPSEVK